MIPAAILTVAVLLGCVAIPAAAILIAAASAARTFSSDRDLADRADLQTWLAKARADQAVRGAVLGTPTRETPIVPMPAAVAPVLADAPRPGRHRIDRLAPPPPVQPPRALAPERPSLLRPGTTLDGAVALLTEIRVRHEARSADFRATMARFA